MAEYVRESELPTPASVNAGEESVKIFEEAIAAAPATYSSFTEEIINEAIITIKAIAESTKTVISLIESEKILSDESVKSQLTSTTSTTIKCPEQAFDIRNFLWKTPGRPMAILTGKKEENIKRVWSEFVVPIYEYYIDQEVFNDSEVCGINITAGILSPEEARTTTGGHNESRHVYGEGIDFNVTNVSVERLFNDIKDGNIGLEWGVLTYTQSYVHITLPYEIEGILFKNVVVYDVDGKTSYEWM